MMESLKEIEQLIETLSGKYNAIKAEQNKVKEEKEKAPEPSDPSEIKLNGKPVDAGQLFEEPRY